MTPLRTPSNNYRNVCRANKIYYGQTAEQYDATETCVVDSRFQQVLTRDLAEIVALVREARGPRIQALDACGGSGNVSLKLARMEGVDVTLCDQSPELLAIFGRKSAAEGLVCHVVNEEIAKYLQTAPAFDLIVFSSALHHLEDYEAVLKLAAGRLNDGGFVFTVFDPIAWKFPARQIVLVEHVFFKMASGGFFNALRGKVRRAVLKLSGKAQSDQGTNWGRIAEYHVQRGIDDLSLAARLRELGLATRWHIREPKARYAFFEGLLKLCKRPTTFKLLLQKQAAAGGMPPAAASLHGGQTAGSGNVLLPVLGGLYRRWLQVGLWPQIKGPAPGPAPVLSYAQLVPDQSRVMSGGNVKLRALNEIFPEHARSFNLLYLVSSGINSRAEAWADVALRKGVKLVWNQNGVAYPAWSPQQHRWLNRRMARLLHRSSFVVYQSRFCKESADLFLGRFDGPSAIVYNAVDTARFCPAERAGRKEGPLKLLIMGSHQHRGRVEAALDAASYVFKQGVDVHVTVAGGLGWPGAAEDFARMLERSGLKDRVFVRGPYRQDEAAGIYRSADILLHLKYADPCPSVVIESMACGVPVIGTASGGLPELVGTDGGGLVPVPGDLNALYVPAPREIADAIRAVQDRLPEYRVSARQRAVRYFDKSIWLEKHRDIFQKVLAEL